MSSIPTTAAHRSFVDSRRGLQAGCLAIGFAAALVYIDWHARFAAVFGASARGDVTAVAGVLLGLAIGAAVAQRLAHNRPTTFVAYLEAAFAAVVLVLPWLLAGLSAADRALLGDIETAGSDWLGIVSQSVIGLLLFAPPAALVALTLAVTIGTESHDAATAGYAIGLASLAAALGACAALAIAPLTGLASLSWLAMAVTAATAGTLLRIAGRTTAPRESERRASTQALEATPTTVTASGRLEVSRVARARASARDIGAHTTGRAGTWCLRGAALLAGAGAFAGQHLWYRVIAHSDAADARSSLVLLIAALAGIGLGALAGQRLIATRASLRIGVAALNLLAAVATVLLYLRAMAWLTPVVPAPWLHAAWPAVIAFSFGVLGMTLTILAELGTAIARSVPAAALRDLALVAVGGAAGSVVAWLWLLPIGGFEALGKGVAAIYVVVALLTIPLMRARARVATGIAATLVAAMTATLTLGRPTVTAVDTADDVIAVARPTERFYAAGREHTVRVVEHQGRFIVQIDGKARASVPVSGSAPTQDAHKWLATLPVTARPAARSLLVLGLGGGMTLEGVPRSIAHVDVVEAEAAVVAANRAIAAERVADPLAQPSVTIIANTPRRALALSAERYDIVVSQLGLVSGPGGGMAPSRELVATLRTHLADDGIVTFLVDGAASNAPIVASLAATLRAELAHVRLYRPEPGSLVFLASATPIEPELQLLGSGAPITNEIMHFSSMGMNGVEDLLAALVADDTGVDALVQHGSVHTDGTLPPDWRDATQSGAAIEDAITATDPLRQRGSWVYANLVATTNFAYLARRLIAHDQQTRALAASEAHPDESTRLTMVGLLHESRDQTQQASAAYEAALERRADNAEARYLLLQPSIAMLAQGGAPPALETVAAELPSSAAALIAARRAGAAQDWGAVAQLDGALGAASVTDAWYPGSVLVRAEWRSRADQNTERLAFDALRLIDRVVLINPDRSFFLLRAAIGIAIGDGNLAVESSRNVVRQIAQLIQSVTDGDRRIERRQIEIIRQNLDAIATNLRGALVAGNERRAEEVRQSASLILRFLDAALSEETQ